MTKFEMYGILAGVVASSDIDNEVRVELAEFIAKERGKLTKQAGYKSPSDKAKEEKDAALTEQAVASLRALDKPSLVSEVIEQMESDCGERLSTAKMTAILRKVAAIKTSGVTYDSVKGKTYYYVIS